MISYFVSRAADGQIVLDRESHGEVLQSFEVDPPSVIQRRIDGALVEFPQWHESFSQARWQVDESKFEYRAGHGWF